MLAHFSQDKELLEAFEKDRDIHAHTASLIFGVKESDVTPEMRSIAKTVNFGIIYGMSPYGLSQSLNIDVNKAKEFIDAYFERYAKVASALKCGRAYARILSFPETPRADAERIFLRARPYTDRPNLDEAYVLENFIIHYLCRKCGETIL